MRHHNFYVMELRENGVILRCELATPNEQNVKLTMCQFIRNFLCHISAKYCLNWFTVGKVITNMKG